MFFHKCRQVSRVIDELNKSHNKKFVSDEICTTYFLRFIMYDIGSNVVQESGSEDKLLNFDF